MKRFSQIQNKIIPQDRIESIRSLQKSQNQVVVFTNGCFDLLHLGHLRYLADARDLGDCLWVGLNSDASVCRLKGETRPIKSEHERALQLASLEFVDFVTIFFEDTPLSLIEKIHPNIHTKGGDYHANDLPETPTVLKLGGRVEILPFVEGKSTTLLIEKIQSS